MSDQLSDNEKIAMFMGVPQLNDYKGILWDFQGSGKEIYSLRGYELRYDTSWEWLMPVVEKISEMFTNDLESEIDHRVMCVTRHQIDAKIEDVYPDVVDFCKWHESQETNKV